MAVQQDVEMAVVLFLIMLALVVLSFMLIFLALMAAVVAVFVSLVFTGIVSTDLIASLYAKSFTKGFKISVILGVTVCALIFSPLAFIMLNAVMLWASFPTALIFGIIIGLLSGLLNGFLAFNLLKLLLQKAAERLKRN